MDLEQTIEMYRKEIQRVSKDERTAIFDEFQKGRDIGYILERGHSLENVFGEFQEGRVVRFLLEQGHSLGNIGQAIVKFSPAAREELPVSVEKYATDLIAKSQSVIKAVNDIKEVDLSKLEDRGLIGLDRFSEYKRLAKQHFEKNGINLNSKMDIDIASKMLEYGHSQTGIEEAILVASPVAQEAGRHREEYSQYVVDKAHRIEELLAVVAEVEDGKKLTLTEGYKIEAAKLIIQEKCWIGQEFDIKIAQSLLVQGYDKGKITAVIGKQSPEVIGKSLDEARKYSTETTKKAQTPEIKNKMPTPAPGGMKM